MQPNVAGTLVEEYPSVGVEYSAHELKCAGGAPEWTQQSAGHHPC